MTKENYFTLIIDSKTSKTSKFRLGVYSVRRKTYVQEMGLDSYFSSDDKDNEALHIACIRATSTNFNEDSMKPRLEGVEIDDVVGTARLVPGKYSGLFQVERVSVVKEARGQGLARELVSELEKEACIRYKEIGAIYLTGEPIAENLYNKIGYYLIPNSKHINYNVWMIKMIKPINEYWKNKDNWNKI